MYLYATKVHFERSSYFIGNFYFMQKYFFCRKIDFQCVLVYCLVVNPHKHWLFIQYTFKTNCCKNNFNVYLFIKLVFVYLQK